MSEGIDVLKKPDREMAEKRLDRFFAGLAPVIRLAKEAQVKVDRHAATGFSIFEYFSENENTLSRIFGDLLNPRGSHGQGSLFLRLFSKHCMDGLKACPPAEPGRCSVRLEDVTKHGRRVDIVVDFSGGVIGIENKPWTIDQKEQLRDYIRHLRVQNANWVMLYLSGSGGSPSDESIRPKLREKIEGCGRFRTIPFCTPGVGTPSLERWLEACIRNCEAERVRWFLKDLLARIRYQFDPHETEPNTEICMTADYIRARPHLLETALMVEEAMPTVRELVVKDFLGELERRLLQNDASGEWEVLKSYDNPNRKIMDGCAWFVLRKKAWDQENEMNDDGIGIASDSPEWSNVYLGVSCRNKNLHPEIRAAAEGCFEGRISLAGAEYGWAASQYLSGDLRNWRGKGFLDRAGSGDKKRGGLLEDLKGKMCGLAKDVEGVFDNRSK